MKELNEIGNLDNVEYPDAATMASLTITKEEKYQNDLEKFFQDAFGQLVNAATNSNNSFTFPIHMSDHTGRQFTTERFVKDIEAKMAELGYLVNIEESEIDQGILNLIHVSWNSPESGEENDG